MKRIFISFAIEDEWARTFLGRQARDERSPFEYMNLSVKSRGIRTGRSAVALASRGATVPSRSSASTRRLRAARWEMTCARQEGVPMIGMHVYADDKRAISAELAGCRVVDWTWPNIAAFLSGL